MCVLGGRSFCLLGKECGVRPHLASSYPSGSEREQHFAFEVQQLVTLPMERGPSWPWSLRNVADGGSPPAPHLHLGRR